MKIKQVKVYLRNNYLDVTYGIYVGGDYLLNMTELNSRRHQLVTFQLVHN